MSSPDKRNPSKAPKPEDIETEPGAWDRFEHAVDAAVKSGPKHRTASQKPMPSKKSGAAKTPVVKK